MSLSNSRILLLVTIFMLLISNKAFAKNYLNIEIADEILALNDQYTVTLNEGVNPDVKHKVDKKLLTFMPQEDKVFYEFTVAIEGDEKQWYVDLFVFSNQKNFLNFNTLLFSALLNPMDFYHLDHRAGYNFFKSYAQHIDGDYEKLKSEYNKGPTHYFSYMDVLGDYQNYMTNVYPVQTKLQQAAKEAQGTKVVAHEKVITNFINAVNKKRSMPLLKYRDPNAPQAHKEIYERGIQTLYAYFEKIGNPTKFNVLQKRKYENINQPIVDYYLVEILEHNGQLDNKIEMEFFFSDVHGKRYIKEYDITGIHFQ
ncbi:hypothetical protein [Pseudoalteromonas pernae]|uniref:hypothetical protein n=1 Tax=Pseudoalteromonas pernae TaxID=3118054 RepID=UPI003242C4EF